MRFKFTIFLFFCALNMQGQTAFEPIEVVFNKPFYLTGETAGFTIWFTGATTAVNSKIVRFDLIDAQGEIIERKKFLRKKSSAEGSYFIPVERKSGYYTFRFYTLNNLNFSENNYSDYVVPIYSSLSPPEVVSKTVNQGKKTIILEEKSIFLKPNKDFKRGEKVEIALNFAAKDMVEYAVTVLSKDWLPGDFKQISGTHKKAIPATYAPETHLTYELKLTNPDDNTPFNSGYILLSQPKTSGFQKVAAKEGKVIFTLPDFLENQEIRNYSGTPELMMILSLFKTLSSLFMSVSITERKTQNECCPDLN